MITVVLPAHNEAARLEKCVKEVKNFLKRKDYEIIIAEDGSKDGTDRIAAGISGRDKKIRLIHSIIRLGKGLALKNAFKIARGEIVCFLDVDLATDMKYLPKLIDYAKDFDVVMGSRYMPQSVTKRPFMRSFASIVYNSFVRNVIGCKVYDTQIGFKAFSKKFIHQEIMKIREKTWAWDTIVVVNAIKKGYRVKEFPVKWIEPKGRRTNMIRLVSDTIIHGRVILKLFLKWRLGVNISL